MSGAACSLGCLGSKPQNLSPAIRGRSCGKRFLPVNSTHKRYNSDIFVKQLKTWIDKELVHFHVVDEIPRGYRFPHPSFDGLPTIDKFVKSERVKKVLDMHRNFTLIGSPFVLPPSTPKDRVQILSGAMRKISRDPETVNLFQKISGPDPLPAL